MSAAAGAAAANGDEELTSGTSGGGAWGAGAGGASAHTRAHAPPPPPPPPPLPPAGLPYPVPLAVCVGGGGGAADGEGGAHEAAQGDPAGAAPLPAALRLHLPLPAAARLAAGGAGLRARVKRWPAVTSGPCAAPLSDHLLADASELASLVAAAAAAPPPPPAWGADPELALRLPLPRLAELLPAAGAAGLPLLGVTLAPCRAVRGAPPATEFSSSEGDDGGDGAPGSASAGSSANGEAASDGSNGGGDAAAPPDASSSSSAGSGGAGSDGPVAADEHVAPLVTLPVLLLPSAHACAEVQSLLPSALAAAGAPHAEPPADIFRPPRGGAAASAAGPGAASLPLGGPMAAGEAFHLRVAPLLLDLAHALAGPAAAPAAAPAGAAGGGPSGGLLSVSFGAPGDGGGGSGSSSAARLPSSGADGMEEYTSLVRGLLAFLLQRGMAHTARAVATAAERAGVTLVARHLLFGDAAPGPRTPAPAPAESSLPPEGNALSGPVSVLETPPAPPPPSQPPRLPRVAARLAVRQAARAGVDSGESSGLGPAAGAAAAAGGGASGSLGLGGAHSGSFAGSFDAPRALATRAPRGASVAAGLLAPRLGTAAPAPASLSPDPEPLAREAQREQAASHPTAAAASQAPASAGVGGAAPPRAPAPAAAADPGGSQAVAASGSRGELLEACLFGFWDPAAESDYAVFKSLAVQCLAACMLAFEAAIVALLLWRRRAPAGGAGDGGAAAVLQSPGAWVYCACALLPLLLPLLPACAGLALRAERRHLEWLLAWRERLVWGAQAVASAATLAAVATDKGGGGDLAALLSAVGAQPVAAALYGQVGGG
jgi:hypothetical protein